MTSPQPAFTQPAPPPPPPPRPHRRGRAVDPQQHRPGGGRRLRRPRAPSGRRPGDSSRGRRGAGVLRRRRARAVRSGVAVHAVGPDEPVGALRRLRLDSRGRRPQRASRRAALLLVVLIATRIVARRRLRARHPDRARGCCGVAGRASRRDRGPDGQPAYGPTAATRRHPIGRRSATPVRIRPYGSPAHRAPTVSPFATSQTTTSGRSRRGTDVSTRTDRPWPRRPAPSRRSLPAADPTVTIPRSTSPRSRRRRRPLGDPAGRPPFDQPTPAYGPRRRRRRPENARTSGVLTLSAMIAVLGVMGIVDLAGAACRSPATSSPRSPWSPADWCSVLGSVGPAG